MTDRIREFLRNRRDEPNDGPCLVVDLDVVRDNYQAFARALPDSRVFYAVKANPAPEVLSLLATLGSSLRLRLGRRDRHGARGRRHARPHLLRQHDQEGARRRCARFELGVRLFAVDCASEVEKIARAAPGSQGVLPHPVRRRRRRVAAVAEVRLRAGAWPIDVLEHAHRLGLDAYGVSFHVGSQQPNPDAWDAALEAGRAASSATLSERGIQLRMVNLGGGFPAKYLKKIPAVKTYGRAIFAALRKHFGNRIPETIIEPGRGMVGDAGVIKAEVVLDLEEGERTTRCAGSISTSASSAASPRRWTRRSATRSAPTTTADAQGAVRHRRPDLRFGRRALREGRPTTLPVSLSIGDEVLIEGTGAYTTTYSAVAFNGFPPLKAYVI